MKKYLFLFLLAFVSLSFFSCSSDDDSEPTVSLERDYISIENAVFHSSAMPTPTSDETLEGVDMSSQVMNGAMNFVTVTTSQKIKKFFVAIKSVGGYLEYTPDAGHATLSDGYNVYVIPVMVSNNYHGDNTLLISSEKTDGEITIAEEREMHYIDTKPGELEVKLAFSNNKDVDLHVETPSGYHIFYGNRGGQYITENGDTLTFGLDIDSNAGCNIDGINKENIYIPKQLVENGTYKVVVDMYQNCNTSLATSWSILARYKGEVITPATGANPAAGVYEVGAGNGDMTQVMTFTISDAESSSSLNRISKMQPARFIPVKHSDIDDMKLIDAGLMPQD